jgi:hypothetical protein
MTALISGDKVESACLLRIVQVIRDHTDFSSLSRRLHARLIDYV